MSLLTNLCCIFNVLPDGSQRYFAIFIVIDIILGFAIGFLCVLYKRLHNSNKAQIRRSKQMQLDLDDFEGKLRHVYRDGRLEAEAQEEECSLNEAAVDEHFVQIEASSLVPGKPSGVCCIISTLSS